MSTVRITAGADVGAECLDCWLDNKAEQATFEITNSVTDQRIPMCTKHAEKARREMGAA